MIDHGPRVTISALCQRVGMSRQNYYKDRRQRQRQQVDEDFIVELVKAERRDQARLGTRKLRVVLKPILEEAGISIGRDRFFETLRKHDLLLESTKSAARTTDSRHSFRVYRNLIKDMVPSRPNEVWVSDITYIRTDEGFVYLALIMDKFSRKIVGFHCGDTLEATGAIRALNQALHQLPAGTACIHHSDRGSQYCCHAYIARLKSRKLQVSMTEEQHCYENANAERLNGILKQEYGLGQTFRRKRQAYPACAQAVNFYNTRRPHVSLDYAIPAEVHKQCA
jgi:putative transposase